METPVPADAPWFAHYPANVPRTIEIPNVRLPELVEASVRDWGTKTAFVYYGKRWTYAEFWEATGQVASALARDGLVAGDRLALYLPNSPAYPIAFFGALRLGLTIVQVSPLYI
ncbi:MAG: AMP-binding protein, partial [Thermoplasmata archaeon]|nr:AMP-binding protein [Thermoplasmata archaeon]